MTKLAIYALVFFLAVFADILAVKWNYNRENGHPIRVAISSALIAIINWSPIVLFVVSENLIIVALDVIGSSVGSYWGTMKYYVEEE